MTTLFTFQEILCARIGDLACLSFSVIRLFVYSLCKLLNAKRACLSEFWESLLRYLNLSNLGARVSKCYVTTYFYALFLEIMPVKVERPSFKILNKSVVI